MNQQEPYLLGIPVRNEEQTIGHLLEQVATQDMPPEKIYVCVNGSSDGTNDIIREAAERVNNIIVLQSDAGKANAWNKIMQRMNMNEQQACVRVFCDGDIHLPEPDTLIKLVRALKTSSHILMGASTLQKPSNRVVPYKNRFPSGQLYGIKPELTNLLNQRYNGQIPSDTINEDLFLTALAYPRFDVTEDSYSISQKPSFPDLLHTQMRILRGVKQLMDRGMSQEIEDMIRDSCNTRKDYFLTTLKYRLIPYIVKMVTVHPHNHLWTEARSTKQCASVLGP